MNMASLKEKVKRWIYKLPLIRGIVARLESLEAKAAHLQLETTVLRDQISTRDAAALLFKELLSEGQPAAKAWQDFYAQIAAHNKQLSETLGKYFQDEQLVHLLGLLLILIAHNAFKDEKTRLSFFEMAQSMGVHIFPVHYYSPVPNTSKLSKNLWQHRFDQSPAFRLDVQAQLAFLSRLAKWAPEMLDTPKIQRSLSEYCWENPAFGAGDALVYYSIIREFKPKVVAEVGGGYSTMVATKAALQNGTTRVWCIDPYPPELLRRDIPELERLIVQPVQEVPLSEFEGLSANDILFIDSTHIGKIGSDVNHIVLNILPRLRSGVLVHFHDIFLPWDYPEPWVVEKKLFWNEQYLVLAFLLFNDEFEILLANQYLAREYPEQFRRAFPFSPVVGGGSFWLRRK